MNTTDVASLILRVAVGMCIAAHGANKVKSRASIDGTAGWFASIGMRWPRRQALLAASTEIVAGIFLVVGFVTPTAAGAVASTMVVAIVVAHRSNGFFIFNDGQGWEYCAILGVACIAIGSLGGGRLSLDHAAGWEYSGNAGLLATLVLTIIGPLVHLGLSYRPGRASQ